MRITFKKIRQMFESILDKYINIDKIKIKEFK